jgi:hypothetical protein
LTFELVADAILHRKCNAASLVQSVSVRPAGVLLCLGKAGAAQDQVCREQTRIVWPGRPAAQGGISPVRRGARGESSPRLCRAVKPPIQDGRRGVEPGADCRVGSASPRAYISTGTCRRTIRLRPIFITLLLQCRPRQESRRHRGKR